MAVSMVHIHHEGGGNPCTAAQCDRFSHGGYCCGIGTDTFRRWRSASENWATADWNHRDWSSASENWATADWNHRDWTPCFSGDRHTNAPISDHDLVVLHNAFMDAYNRGEVTANPQVVAHRNAGGSNATACPGDKAMARWNDIVNACRAGATPQPKPPEPEDEMAFGVQANAMNHDGRPIVFQVGGDGLLYYRVRDAKGGDWGDWRHLDDGLKGFQTVTAWANADKRVEVWATLKDGRTYQRWQTDDFAGWHGWGERTT